MSRQVMLTSDLLKKLHCYMSDEEIGKYMKIYFSVDDKYLAFERFVDMSSEREVLREMKNKAETPEEREAIQRRENQFYWIEDSALCKLGLLFGGDEYPLIQDYEEGDFY